MEQVRLDGKTIIVTGCNTGIGKPTAKELAKRGARVIMACRSKQRALAAKEDILKEAPDISPDQLIFMKLDLSSLKAVRKFAENFNASEPRLDMLVNNAGLFLRERKTTKDGFEYHVGVNHLGGFLLTLLLLDKLKASAPARIVNVSSDAHKRLGKIDFEDFQIERNWSNMSKNGYGQSKTANILFTVALAKRLKGTGVTTYALHPGAVDTDIFRSTTGCLICCIDWIKCCCPCIFVKPAKGAETTLYCCLEPTIANDTGKYYSKKKEAQAADYATDPEIAEQLWSVSEELVGQRYAVTSGY